MLKTTKLLEIGCVNCLTASTPPPLHLSTSPLLHLNQKERANFTRTACSQRQMAPHPGSTKDLILAPRAFHQAEDCFNTLTPATLFPHMYFAFGENLAVALSDEAAGLAADHAAGPEWEVCLGINSGRLHVKDMTNPEQHDNKLRVITSALYNITFNRLVILLKLNRCLTLISVNKYLYSSGRQIHSIAVVAECRTEGQSQKPMLLLRDMQINGTRQKGDRRQCSARAALGSGQYGSGPDILLAELPLDWSSYSTNHLQESLPLIVNRTLKSAWAEDNDEDVIMQITALGTDNAHCLRWEGAGEWRKLQRNDAQGGRGGPWDNITSVKHTCQTTGFSAVWTLYVRLAEGGKSRLDEQQTGSDPGPPGAPSGSSWKRAAECVFLLTVSALRGEFCRGTREYAARILQSSPRETAPSGKRGILPETAVLRGEKNLFGCRAAAVARRKMKDFSFCSPNESSNDGSIPKSAERSHCAAP
ncbi:hypothetical protein P4O66_021781 [Electrophorus voltai]|uniref:Uncharacterized protein n=1 Tax=Electrophorus voltai TaxID=2609070 RepID=A0AAD8ZN60_9TELE|nr:hypothetical protein P4O66_021781 [Electrophorus voltai]